MCVQFISNQLFVFTHFIFYHLFKSIIEKYFFAMFISQLLYYFVFVIVNKHLDYCQPWHTARKKNFETDRTFATFYLGGQSRN